MKKTRTNSKARSGIKVVLGALVMSGMFVGSSFAADFDFLTMQTGANVIPSSLNSSTLNLALPQ